MAIQQVESDAKSGVPGPTGATGSMLSAGGITALSAKTTPADNDLLLLEDSADSLKMKKTLWSSIKSTLKAYFDTLYQAILTLPLSTTNGGTGSSANANDTNGVVVLNGSKQLPAVSGALLTNLPITPQVGLGAWTSGPGIGSVAGPAATDGFFVGTWYGSGSNSVAQIRTDSSNPPTTVRISLESQTGSQSDAFCCLVKKGYYYYCINTSASGSLGSSFFISIGS
jgi:hypothetical protein